MLKWRFVWHVSFLEMYISNTLVNMDCTWTLLSEIFCHSWHWLEHQISHIEFRVFKSFYYTSSCKYPISNNQTKWKKQLNSFYINTKFIGILSKSMRIFSYWVNDLGSTIFQKFWEEPEVGIVILDIAFPHFNVIFDKLNWIWKQSFITIYNSIQRKIEKLICTITILLKL